MIINEQKHYCDLCETELNDDNSTKGYYEGRDVRSHYIGFAMSLHRVTETRWMFRTKLGDHYTEVCKECADYITKAIDDRRKLRDLKVS